MKKYTALVLATALLMSLSGCGDVEQSNESETSANSAAAPESKASQESTADSAVESKAEESSESKSEEKDSTAQASSSTAAAEPVQGGSVTLYADFSAGTGIADLITTKTVELSGEVDVWAVAEQLTSWTGYKFIFNDVITEGSDIYIDWSADSTLIAGVGDMEMKEDFFVYDAESMRWLMMDSLYMTLIENGMAENVYYSTNYGDDIVFEGKSPISVISGTSPYMGKAFYDAHSETRGESDVSFAETAGTWYLDGSYDAASIYMDGTGSYTAYYADGAVESQGYLEYSDDYADTVSYVMYDGVSGEPFGSFVFDSATTIHLGNNAGLVYILDGTF